MDAQDDDIPEFAAPAPKKKAAPKPKPAPVEIEAEPAPPKEFVSIIALRKMHIDPADLKDYRGAEAISLRLEPNQRLDNLKAAKAGSLIAQGLARGV